MFNAVQFKVFLVQKDGVLPISVSKILTVLTLAMFVMKAKYQESVLEVLAITSQLD